MSIPQRPLPAQPVLSILSSKWETFWPDLLEALHPLLGVVDYVSEVLDFKETSYYDQELGTPIQRRIVGFENLVDPSNLVEIKVFTNKLEQQNLSDNHRLFNLDPGLIFMERFVLATGKNFSHRIYLRDGIWADLTLLFQQGKWQNLPWTFPDYASNKIQDILIYLRNSYKQKLKLIRKEK